MATNNIVLKLRAQEANDIFFRELSGMLRAVRTTVESPALADLATALMPAVLEETKVQLDVHQLSEACKSVWTTVHCPAYLSSVLVWCCLLQFLYRSYLASVRYCSIRTMGWLSAASIANPVLPLMAVDGKHIFAAETAFFLTLSRHVGRQQERAPS